MLRNVRVVWTALKGDIQSDLDAVFIRLHDKPAKIIEAAELRMNRLVTALRRADRPRTAGIVGFGGASVVLSFALGAPDGMDRRQIKCIEAHRRDVRQAP